MEEGLTSRGQTDTDESDLALSKFREPRDAIVCITAEFFSRCTQRVKELRVILGDYGLGAGGGGGSGSSGGGGRHELLDQKGHNVRLSESLS